MSKNKTRITDQKPNGPDLYVDQLIDPNIEEDSFEDVFVNPAESVLSIHNTLEFLTEWRKNSLDGDGLLNTGLSYSAYKSAGNYGDLSLEVTAMDDNAGYGFSLNQADSDDMSIGHYVFRQRNFPLTETISMNNTVGTHNPSLSSRNPIVIRNLISRRFSSNESQILGMTSQWIKNNSQLAVSIGRLGRNQGAILPGFELTDGRVQRAQLSHVFENQFVTLDYWRTNGFDEASENRNGYRVTLDSILFDTWKSSITFGTSGANKVFLAGAEQHHNEARQSLGLYYYEPDFLWVDRRIGNDNAGAYYRYSATGRAFTYGGSIEYRRDGLDKEINARDTLLFNGSLGYRLSRASRLNGFYSYRHVDDTNENDVYGSYQEHRFRAFYTMSHRNGNNSTLGASLRHRRVDQGRDNNTDYSLYYSFNRVFDNGSEFNLTMGYSREQNGQNENSGYNVNAAWSQTIGSGHSLSLNVGYGDATSDRVSNRGFNASLNYDWSVRDNLSLNLQLGHNNSINELEVRQDISSDLVTDTELGEIEAMEFNSYSALLTLRYSFGGARELGIIAGRPGKIGSGTIKGVIYADENGDGKRQSNEELLKGVEVFLNSVYATKTDANGRFVFRNVGTGEHVILVDESALPLPWSLNGNEFHEVIVGLRSVNELEIAVTDLALADAENY